MTPTFTIVRVNQDQLRLDCISEPAGPVAFINQVCDRLGAPLGWQLKPLVVMRGAKSHVWPTPNAAVAATGLMTAKQARAAIAAASAQRIAP